MADQKRARFLDKLFFRWVAVGLLVAVIWFVIYLRGWGLPPLMRAMLAVPILFLLPGYLLQRVLAPHPRGDGLVGLAVSFALSVGVATLVWGGTQFVGGGLAVVSAALGSILTVLVVWAMWRQRQNVEPSLEYSPQVWWPYLLVGIVTLFWVFVAACWGALFMPETDNWYYLAGVRRILQTQQLAPGDPYFRDVADPGRGSPWLALVALVVHISGLNVETVWQTAPALLVAVAVCAHYALGQALFKDRLAAALSCLFLLYGFGRFTWDAPMMVVSPAGVGFTLFLTALAMIWHFAQDRQRQLLIPILLICLSLAAIHILVYVGLLAAISLFAVIHLIIHRQWGYAGRLLVLILVLVLLAIPFLGGWLSSGPQTGNPTYTDEWGLLSEFGGWHIIRPGAVIGSGPSPWAWAFMLLPLLVVLAKRQPWALFLLSTMLFVVLTAFNPLFVEPILRFRLIPAWGIWRLALQVFQFQLVLGIFGADALRWLWQRMAQEWTTRRLARALLLLMAVGVAFLPSSVPLVRPLWGYVSESFSRLADRETRFPFNWHTVVSFLNNEMEAGSVILTDPNTSFFVSALSAQYVVAIPHGHSSPLVSDDAQRRQDVAAVLDPDTDMEQVYSILERRQVDYILLTFQSPPSGTWALSDETYEQLATRFDGDPQHFQRVFADEANPMRRTVIFAYKPWGD